MRRCALLLFIANGLCGCVDDSLVADPWADAGPDFAGSGLSTHLHSAEDGRVLARLKARKFRGFEASGKQVLEGVTVEFVAAGLKVFSRRAELLGPESVELRGDVHGEMLGGRRFRTPSLVFSSKTKRLEMAGPVEFFGKGYELRALGGASVDELFNGLKLIGPIKGVARVAP
jgi:hypothetical protein